MKIDIEIYRNWTIQFDTEKESFYCHSEQYDKDMNKQSYSAVKKFIDDFIKDNKSFKPFWVSPKPNSFLYTGKVKIIGIRKDGRFVYEDKEGKKQQIPDYNEKDYVLHSEEIDLMNKEVDEVQKEIDYLNQKIKSIRKNFSGVELTEYKKTLID